MRQFLTNLTIGAGKRDMVYGVMPLCSLLYGIMPEQIQFYLYVVICGSFLATIGFISFKGILFIIQQNFPRKNTYPTEIPELLSLADKIGLDLSPQPFWKIDKKIIKARALGGSKKSKRIIFGKDYLASLTSEEKIFVGGHEFFHLYGHELVYFLIILVPTLAVMYLIPLTLHVPQSVIVIGMFGSIIGWFCFSKRSFESIADLYSAVHTSREAAVSALEKAYADKTEIKFYLHPSLKERIINLDRYYSQLNRSQ